MESELLLPIRNAVRAVIIKREQILLLRKRGGRFALPGGGQDLGESLEDALQRECEEEIATRVEIDYLAGVCEWIKDRDTQPPTQRHLLELLFLCRVADNYRPQNGYHPDKNQLEVVWVPLQRLTEINISPDGIAEKLLMIASKPNQPYANIYHGWIG